MRERRHLKLIAGLAAALFWMGGATAHADDFCEGILGGMQTAPARIFETSAERQAAWGRHSLAGPMTPDQEAAMVEEFVRDGRKIVIFTDSHDGMKSGVTSVMNVFKSYIPEILQGKVPVQVIDSGMLPGVDLSYADMRVAKITRRRIKKLIAGAQAIHIAMEGPVGIQVRQYLERHHIPYTTAFHTMRPELVQTTTAKFLKTFGLPTRVGRRAGAPLAKITQDFMIRFHRTSAGVMVPSRALRKILIQRGYYADNLIDWSHGVEVDLFRPDLRDQGKWYPGLEGPITLYAGRVSPEKSIDDFLDMKIVGTKVVVGGGDDLARLKEKYSAHQDIVFLGHQDRATQLPGLMASADVFVFPSREDTVGLVQIESMAGGTPVIAPRVQGPEDVITSPDVGVLVDYTPQDREGYLRGMEEAWYKALHLDRAKVRAHAETLDWKRSVLEFLHFLNRLPKSYL